MAAERVITVEYLEPSMSKELLLKFPDDSAFGFDYEQSAIWSPLIPRGRTAAVSFPFMGTRLRTARDGCKKISTGKLRKVKGAIMKRTTNKQKIKQRKSLSTSDIPHHQQVYNCLNEGQQKVLEKDV